MWALRIAHESSLYSDSRGNSFVTLTYRDKETCTKEEKAKGLFIPGTRSLDKTHFQKFMKRLRKRETGHRIKYYQCGEYGSQCEHGFDLNRQKCPLCNVGRPHHHAILFNQRFDDLEPYAVQKGVTRYTSKTLSDLWGYGFVDVGEVTIQSAGYVARYIMKKINGVQAEDHYKRITESGEIVKLEPEYSTMSNGIGKDWYEKYKTDCWPEDEVPAPGRDPVKKVPRYYEEMLKGEDPELHQKIKNLRQKFRRENAAEYTPERLQSKYRVKKAQISSLTRE